MHETRIPDLVLLHHDEPMTTSLAIADGVRMEHKSVIQLVRKYIDDIGSFGPIAFEMRKGAPLPHGGYGKATEFAWLNEQQSTFLLTLMRNSPVVVEFKKALVRAFFALRDRVRAEQAAPGPFLTGNPAHAADQLVSADRIFRSILRSSRSIGLPLSRALRRANEVARGRTGIDLLHEIDAEDVANDPATAAAPDPLGVHAFCSEWMAGAIPLPWVPCRSEDLYAAYRHWCVCTGRPPGAMASVIAAIVRRPDLRHRRARHQSVDGRVVMSGFVLPEHELSPPAGMSQMDWLSGRGGEFSAALQEWAHCAASGAPGGPASAEKTSSPESL